MIKCCIYFRARGTREDNEQFVLSKLQELMNYAYKKRIIVRQVFADFHSSAESLNDSPELMNMVRLIQSEYIDHVITFDITTISNHRDVLQQFSGLISAFHTTLLTTRME